ncbi:FAD-binding oxidoreductase [Pseudomarimonas arenosa]|uniref:FAD-binding protein n=1 Tax=Pseudomarimonas arenosa TaxID=2774145 RepID=A0AAW3ZFX2_9GAMM|nr:FAD-linked oxidase C-terminal domain-containing protein [Pseudomarimonas arenosa]MBD8525045.1 FAD-binding protein [Pseudomarimonas arenosa]
MSQPPINALAQRLRHELPTLALFDDAANREVYAYDNSKRRGVPDLVALAESHAEVEIIVRHCHELAVPLIARGRGSNTTGASIAASGGLVLSLERMQRILHIVPGDRYAQVEAGVLNGDLNQTLQQHGLCWAPDPTSAPYSSIGGNLACNAGGPRTVKYGAARDNLLALRGVDGRGRGFRCGAAVSKLSTGFDLARLLVGSEGTLAVITEATLLLTPLAEAKRGMRALFDSVESAASAVARIMAQPVRPCALEFMDSAALGLVRSRGVDLPVGAAALLLIEVDGRAVELADQCQAIQKAADGAGLIEFQIASDDTALAGLWAARRALSPALRELAPTKVNEDVVVPVSRLPDLVRSVVDFGRQAGITVVCFGHAGNGNLHVNLMFDGADPRQAEAAEHCLNQVFDRVIELGGMLSGEHGIGLAKRDFMQRALDPVTLDLMRRIKAEFDPKGILNPGKLLPPAIA